MDNNKSITSSGFFIKFKDGSYSGSIDRLKDARSEARKFGNDILIYHGELIKNSDGSYIDANLFLVPKLRKAI